MPREMDLTKKVTSIIKGTDKLVQDVLKDARQIKDSITSLKDSLKKPKNKDQG
jgi:hypothetical protein